MRLRFAKNKKLMITAIVLSVPFILGDAGVLFLSQEKFGHIPQGKRLERIKQSPNYDGKQFVNEVETVTMTGDRSVFVVWKVFLFGDKSQTVPDTAMNVIKTDLPGDFARPLGPPGLPGGDGTGTSRKACGNWPRRGRAF